MVDAPGENPTLQETTPAAALTPPEAMPNLAREDLRDLAQEVFDTNTRETVELIQALRELRKFLDSGYTEPKPGSRKILKEAIQNAMIVLGDVKDIERNPGSTQENYEHAVALFTALTADAQQNFMAILRNPRHGISGNDLVAKVDTAFDEKIAALTRIKQNIEAGNFVPKQPSVSPDASAGTSSVPGAPEAAPSSPEEQAFDDAVEADLGVGNKFRELLLKTHTDFRTQMEALREELKLSKDKVDQGLAELSVGVRGIENDLREIDSLAAAGKGQEASTKLTALKTRLHTEVDKAIKRLTDARNETGFLARLDDQEKTIVDQAIANLTASKDQIDPLAVERTQTLAAVQEKGQVLADKKIEIPARAPSAASQRAGELETALSELQEDVPAIDTDPENMTAEEFMDSIQNTWEEVSEAMQAKEWGAVLAGALAMAIIVAKRLGSLDSIGDLLAFVGDYGKEETPEGAPEKPATKEAVLVQFGIEEEGKQQKFFALKAAEVARFVERDGEALATGETPYPQILVDLKANQSDDYEKFKQQLNLNGLKPYYDGLSADDKPLKTLADFITHRLTSDATKQEGWKIA